VKADGTMSLVKSAHSTVFFDTGLPLDKKFILKGMVAICLQICIYFVALVAISTLFTMSGKSATIFWLLTLPNADRFSNFFTDRLSSKFVVQR